MGVRDPQRLRHRLLVKRLLVYKVTRALRQEATARIRAHRSSPHHLLWTALRDRHSLDLCDPTPQQRLHLPGFPAIILAATLLRSRRNIFSSKHINHCSQILETEHCAALMQTCIARTDHITAPSKVVPEAKAAKDSSVKMK